MVGWGRWRGRLRACLRLRWCDNHAVRDGRGALGDVLAGLLHATCDRRRHAGLLRHQQRVRGAVAVAGAASAPDAVHVRVQARGDVAVHDGLHAAHVQAARCDVRRHEHVHRAVLELLQSLHAAVLVDVAVDAGALQTGRLHRSRLVVLVFAVFVALAAVPAQAAILAPPGILDVP